MIAIQMGRQTNMERSGKKWTCPQCNERNSTELRADQPSFLGCETCHYVWEEEPSLKRLEILRTCASCEWIFKAQYGDFDCPMCRFVSYGAYHVYGDFVYRYAKTQKPWKDKKLLDFELHLDEVIQRRQTMSYDELIYTGPPPTNHREALEITHQSWKHTLQMCNNGIIGVVHTGGETCGFCMMYFNKTYTCDGCPVKTATQKRRCMNSYMTNYLRAIGEYQTQDARNDLCGEFDVPVNEQVIAAVQVRYTILDIIEAIEGDLTDYVTREERNVPN